MQILIGKMENPSSKRVKAAIAWNMEWHESKGNGNRWKRRAGIPVADSTYTFPYAMNAEQKAKFFNF